MKKMLKVLLLFLSLSTTFLSAQEIEKMYLKNGSVLNGYILEQEPGIKILFTSTGDGNNNGLRMVDTDIYEIYWNDILYIEKEDKSDLLLSGINSKIILKSGKSHIGSIKEIYPGQKLKLKKENNEIHEFNYSDIESIEKIKINVNQSLSEQFYYIEQILLKNDETLYAYIVSQNVNKSILVFSNDDVIEIDLADIKKIKRLINDKYTPIYDVVLQPDQYVYNNIDIKFQIIEPTPAHIYIVDVESEEIIDVNVGQKVSIYANLIDKHTKVSVVKTSKITEKANLFGNKENHYETFKMDDIVNSNIVVEKSDVSKAGTTEFSFTPYEKGYYVLQVSNKEGYVVISVI